MDDVRQLAIPAELSKLVEVTEVIEPRTIDIGIEPKRGKSVAVKARIVGEPPEGYATRGPARVDPDTAWVTGPASIVSGLDTLFTLPVDIAGERERIHRQVLLDAGSNLLAVQPRRPLGRAGKRRGPAPARADRAFRADPLKPDVDGRADAAAP